jgi:hypothetical protein
MGMPLLSSASLSLFSKMFRPRSIFPGQLLGLPVQEAFDQVFAQYRAESGRGEHRFCFDRSRLGTQFVSLLFESVRSLPDHLGSGHPDPTRTGGRCFSNASLLADILLDASNGDGPPEINSERLGEIWAHLTLGQAVDQAFELAFSGDLAQLLPVEKVYAKARFETGILDLLWAFFRTADLGYENALLCVGAFLGAVVDDVNYDPRMHHDRRHFRPAARAGTTGPAVLAHRAC